MIDDVKLNMQMDMAEMMKEPTIERVQAFRAKYDPKHMRPLTNMQILETVHKAKIRLNIDVEGSLRWFRDTAGRDLNKAEFAELFEDQED